MNRKQRRAAGKKVRHAGRVTTVEKDGPPRGFVTIRDEKGNVIKTVPLEAEEVSEEEFMEVQRQQAAQKEAQMRLQAHTQGLWLPGDPIQ
jgi:hypothetical protein